MVREVDVLAADLSVHDAMMTLAAGRHRVYTVVDAQRRPVGLVSRADALLWQVEGGHDDERLADRVSDASLPLVYPDDMTARAVDVMLATDQGRLPVVDRRTGVMVGLLTRKDLLKVRASMARSEGERRAYLAWGKRSVARPGDAGRASRLP